MELGIWDGGSVALWYDVLRPRKHVAVDLLKRDDSGYFKRFVAALDAADRLRTYWGVDQADEATLLKIVDAEFDGPLDLVIDDASHLYEPTRASFETLFPRLATGGLYIIEDWAWEHWEDFDVPGNAFQGRESPTRLIQELAECAGTRGSPIAGIAIETGFTVVERSSVPLATDRPFRLAEHVSRRLLCGPRSELAQRLSMDAEQAASQSVFVVSWNGQHDRAIAIADAIERDGSKVTIVFSDPDLCRVLDTECPTIRRPDHLFWGDKFTACLERCSTDTMLVIHADCSCDDWPGLVRRCRQVLTAVPHCAIWAPYIDGTPYASDVATFARLTADGVQAAAQTDGIVLGLTRPILDRLREARLDENLYGWGIDQMAVAAAYAGGQMAAIDLSARVVHPPGCGYPSDDAHGQWRDFLRQLSPPEREWHEVLWAFVTAGVALKARRTGSVISFGGRMISAEGPQTTAMLEAGVDTVRTELQRRCESRLPPASVAAGRRPVVAPSAAESACIAHSAHRGMQAVDFLGIGAQKSGSTWLFHQLSRHPQVAFPRGKEFHYWNQVGAVDADTWVKLLQPDSRVTRDGRPIRTGEITPAYAVLPESVIRALHRRCPQLRLFISLRNPIERAWSAALMGLYRCGMEVHEASDKWFMDHFLSAGSLARGDYAACLSRWWSVFPRDQLQVFFVEDIAERPADVLATLAAHLEIDAADFLILPRARLTEQIVPRTWTNADATKPHPIRPSLVAPLLELYADGISRLERLLGRDLSAWRCSPPETHDNRERIPVVAVSTPR